MIKHETAEGEPSHEVGTLRQGRSLEIPRALPVRLQTLDLARHTAIAPDKKRYVVATFDDSTLKRGIITAVYPQQNEYLTLIRLVLCEFSSETPDEARQLHIDVVQAIQQGKLNAIMRKAQAHPVTNSHHA